MRPVLHAAFTALLLAVPLVHADKLNSKVEGGSGEFEALLLEVVPPSPTAIILLHGRGGHPDEKVVAPLRRSLYKAGYSTLSIALPRPPGGSDEFKNYVADATGSNRVFPEACARIRTAMAELKQRKVKEIVLVGFSLGARLSTACLTTPTPGPLPVLGLVAIGNGANSVAPLNSALMLDKVSVPVLDLYGDADKDVAASAAARRAAYERGSGKSFTQVMVPGNVPHAFTGHEAELVKEVDSWVRRIAPLGRGL